MVCQVSFLPKLSKTKQGFDNDSRVLVWRTVCIGMEELHESLGGIINYYVGASCCFRQHCQGLL